ncbi:Mechanosensitive channel of small conductance-like 10, putative isoform 1 [Hibiscus syriacus]|uniref:Mechanosensitive channel of small conductance-like 10, putative isoform 1 n=1 Tax=Hibiscus syriacus TaxID=106335 RepID=A0A6A3BAU1_HIBSY|nr:serine/threonine-protein kinase STY46-like [Hibiscus syriacus]KAE8714046.1 Mechanosensitive channel of small conductance-like 10, putative isoform 1 [Hibiscus syriacus]
MNSSSGTPEQNRDTISHHQQALVTTRPLVKTEKATPSRQLCFSFNDCLGKGSVASANPHRLQQGTQQRSNHPNSKLEKQVAELEKEVQKQKEIRTMYKMKMERTQDYLRYSLQIAQDKGFLDHIINRKSPISRDVVLDVNTSAPQLPASASHQSDIGLLIDQAKLNGWFINPLEIELQEKVGQGSTADIYRGIWRGIEVAVKRVYPDFFENNENGVAFFAQEVETLSKQRHRFILQLMGACLEPPMRGWIVTELLSMTLRDWLHGPGNNRKKGRATQLPPFEERLSKAVEIAQAMQYLHEQKPKVIHRDLKPSNIFLDDAKHIRVADFGHARFLSDEEMALTGETGTYVYMAPEIIRCEPYNEKSDVYSFGIILNELITGNHPYIETNYGPAMIAMEVGEGKLRPALPEDNGELGEVIELICQSWDEDASVRPAFASITSTLSNFQIRFKEKYCLVQYSSLH